MWDPRRGLAPIGRLLVILVAAFALAGCSVLGVSTLPAAAPVPAATPTDEPTAIPPTATATERVVVAAAPTRTAVPPTSTPTVEPTATDTPVPPTATATEEPSPTFTPKPPTKTPTPKPTATKAPTKTSTPKPKATATKVTTRSSKAVGLDPGHHRLDQGGYALYGVKEYQLTMETALAVKSILQSKGYTVRLARTSSNPVSCWCASDYIAKVQAEQQARIKAVGVVGAYVPIHFNASPSHTLKGTEAYYNVSTSFASRSRSLAQSLVSNVVAQVRGAGYAVANRGVKSDLLAGKSYGHYFGLRGPYPATLLESMFMDQPNDAAALQKPSIRAAIARGIANGIIAYLK